MPKSSGRPSRSASRKTTPFKNLTITNAAPAATGTKSTEKPATKTKSKAKDLDQSYQLQWVEPPLAEPRASYKDYDITAQPNSSTAYMQPLGTLPTAKLLPKQHGGKKAGKGATVNGNGNGKGASSQGAKDANGAKALEPSASTAVLNMETVTITPPSPTVELRKFTFPDAPEEFPSTKTEVGRQKLTAVVQAAVDRSAAVGMEVLGKAIQRLYEDSMENPELGELLDAVLAQKATQAQTEAFQAHIRTAREKLEKQQISPAGPDGTLLVVPPFTKGPTTAKSSGKKAVAPDAARGKKGGRRSSRRIQENHEVMPQPLEGALELPNISTSNLIPPPFQGGPSEPSPPPATVTQSHDKAKQTAKANNEATAAELDLRYEQVTRELRAKMPSQNASISESGIRFSDTEDEDGDSLVATSAAGVGVSTRASARKENTNPRKRARSPEPPSTPPPPNGTSAVMADPLEIGGPPKKKRQTRVKTS